MKATVSSAAAASNKPFCHQTDAEQIAGALGQIAGGRVRVWRLGFFHVKGIRANRRGRSYPFQFLTVEEGEDDEDNKKEETENRGLTLCQILRAAKLNIADFLKELPQFDVKTGPILSSLYDTDWEKGLEVKEMEANVHQLSILSKCYKCAYGDFLANEANVENHSSITVHASEYHEFEWLLFLADRVHTFYHLKDLVTYTTGRKVGDLLASLCNMYHTSEEELRKTMEIASNLIAEILKKPSLASECKNENQENSDTDGLICFRGLMEELCLQSSLNILKNDDYAIYNNFELDERTFIDEEDSLLASGSFTEGCDTIKMQLSCFNPKDKVCRGGVCWGCTEMQEQFFAGKKPPLSTSNSHLEGKVKLRGRGNDGTGIF